MDFVARISSHGFHRTDFVAVALVGGALSHTFRCCVVVVLGR
jgi:hypothetical protein